MYFVSNLLVQRVLWLLNSRIVGIYLHFAQTCDILSEWEAFYDNNFVGGLEGS